MDDNVMERYVAFICSEIPEKVRVYLNPPPPKPDGELGYTLIPKMGPSVTMEAKVKIIQKYTRSAKFLLTFDGYEHEDIFFMSRHKSPDLILYEIESKINRIVNQRYVIEGRVEWIREQYANAKPFRFNFKHLNSDE